MIRLADAVPGDETAIAALCAELDQFYGDTPHGTPDARAAQVRAALFADPPLACALLAWNGPALAGFASYSFLWPAAGLTTSLYLKELYVAAAYRRGGIGELLMDGLYRIAADRGCSRVEWTTDSRLWAQLIVQSGEGDNPAYAQAIAPCAAVLRSPRLARSMCVRSTVGEAARLRTAP